MSNTQDDEHRSQNFIHLFGVGGGVVNWVFTRNHNTDYHNNGILYNDIYNVIHYMSPKTL